MPGCLSAEVVEDFLDQRLDQEASAVVAQHLSGCATCAELRAALAEDREVVRDLRQLAAATESATATRPAVPGYDVRDEIHRGGQGVVYAATQLSTGRPAAVKALLSGSRATPEERHRFEREVALAANLRHPGIVTVFDGGTTAEGVMWLAMELVDGVPLDRWLSERSPSTPEALALFRDVCDAVQHAHQNGVIHRDLKPGNVLVDRAGRPRVLDFGLAKQVLSAGEASMRDTASGAFVGTLHWAAPEQLRGDPRLVDVRTDVHALGLVLFRMLTGRLPWPDDAGLADLMRAIAETDAPRPSSLATGVDRDLDAIVLKALAKEPDRRYASAGELRRDLERHLAGDPVEARGPDRWYVLRRTLRRHRVLVAAAAIVFLGLGAATAISLVYSREAETKRVEASQAASRALEEAERADEVVGLMRKALESGRSLRKGRAMTMADFLDDAAADLDAHLPRHPRAEAQLRTSLGVTYARLGLLPKSVAQLRKAVALHEKAGGLDDPERLAAMVEFARALFAATAKSDAESSALVDEVLARRGRAAGPDDPIVLGARLQRAYHWRKDGRGAEALAEIVDIEGRLRARGEAGGELAFKAFTAHVASLQQLQRWSEAEALLVAALDGAKAADRRVEMLWYLVSNLLRQERIDEAIARGTEAIDVATKAYAEDQPMVAQLRLVLGAALHKAERYAEAETQFQKLLDSQARVPFCAPADLQLANARLGEMLCGRGAFAQAEPCLRKAVALAPQCGGPNAMGSRISRRALAWALLGTGAFAESERLLRELASPDPPDGTDREANFIVDLLARVLAAQGRNDESEAQYRLLADLGFPPSLGLERKDVLTRYAAVLRALGRTGRAEEIEQAAAELREKR